MTCLIRSTQANLSVDYRINWSKTFITSAECLHLCHITSLNHETEILLWSQVLPTLKGREFIRHVHHGVGILGTILESCLPHRPNGCSCTLYSVRSRGFWDFLCSPRFLGCPLLTSFHLAFQLPGYFVPFPLEVEQLNSIYGLSHSLALVSSINFCYMDKWKWFLLEIKINLDDIKEHIQC